MLRVVEAGEQGADGGPEEDGGGRGADFDGVATVGGEARGA